MISRIRLCLCLLTTFTFPCFMNGGNGRVIGHEDEEVTQDDRGVERLVTRRKSQDT